MVITSSPIVVGVVVVVVVVCVVVVVVLAILFKTTLVGDSVDVICCVEPGSFNNSWVLLLLLLSGDCSIAVSSVPFIFSLVSTELSSGSSMFTSYGEEAAGGLLNPSVSICRLSNASLHSNL